jgi:hypothetical protein
MPTLRHILFLGLIACQPEKAPEIHSPSSLDQAAPAAETDGALVGISIEVQDYQVFHPFSRSRALLQHASPTLASKKKRKKGLAKAKDAFGAGLVVDATNTSPHLLSEPDLIGEFVMKGAHGTARCELDPKRIRRGQGTNHLSRDPTSKAEWRDESKQTYEKVWRPGETIRLRIREDCGNFFVYDTQLELITTSFKVEARAMLSPGRPDLSFPLSGPDAPLVRSETMTLSLPPASVMLQKVQLGERWAFAAADVVISWDGTRVVRSTLGGMGHRADTLTREDLSAELPDATADFNELSFKPSTTKLIHWTDGDNISKGQRRLEIEAQLSLDTAAIQRRFAEGIDASTPQGTAAIKKGVASETNRLLALLPCNRIVLVTTKREVGPSNSGELIGACGALSADAPAALRLRYRLGRYEVPIGLVLRTRTTQKFVPIAHQALISFDAR